MSEEKKRRVVSATVSGAIMLLFILVAIVVYQIVGIYVRKNRIQTLDNEIATLEQEILDTEYNKLPFNLTIDNVHCHNDWKIEQRARELGLIYEEDDE